MQKNLLIHKILVSFFILINIYILEVQNSMADEYSSIAQRGILVRNELLCVEKNLKSSGEISWNDVCYFYEKKQSSNPMRRDIINNALNEFERITEIKEGRGGRSTRNPVRVQKKTSPRKLFRSQYQESFENSKSRRFKYSSPRSLQKVKVTQNKNLQRVKGNVQLTSGYRVDNMKWNIAGDINGQNPNVASENEWSKIRIAQIQARGSAVVDDTWVVEGLGAFGTIVDGHNRESEFRLNEDELGRVNSSTDGNNAWDFSAGLGYRYVIKNLKDYPAVVEALTLEPTLFLDNFWITVLGGYSLHKLNLRTTDGNQTIDTQNLYGLGLFPGLNSKYESQWKGPWIGFEVYGDIKKLWSKLRLGYHFANYNAESDLNLRTDVNHPKSFEHTANGRGRVVNFVIGYNMNDNWSLDFNVDYQNWKAENGLDKLFRDDGTVKETRLNEVKWRSLSFMLGTTYRF